MADRLLLVNPAKPPSKRRRKPAAAKKGTRATSGRKSTKPKKVKTMAKARRSAKQKAAARKLVAWNKRNRRKGAAKRRSNPRRKTVARRPAAPRRRTGVARRTGRPVRRRRNPIQRGIVERLVMPAVTAAGGAVALDVVWSYLPLPPMVKMGPFRHLAKLGGAVALGWVASKVVKKKTADAITLGAATVILHDVFSDALRRFMPAVQLDSGSMGYYPGGMGYYNPALPAGTADAVSNMGFYPGPTGTAASEMGYYASAY